MMVIIAVMMMVIITMMESVIDFLKNLCWWKLLKLLPQSIWFQSHTGGNDPTGKTSVRAARCLSWKRNQTLLYAFHCEGAWNHFSCILCYYFDFLSLGVLAGPLALSYLEQHIRRTVGDYHLQGVPQHCTGHGHPHGAAGAKHQGGARPLSLWDCSWAQQAAATWHRWQTINVRPLWRNIFSQVRSWRIEDATIFLSSRSNIGSIGGTYAKPVILPPQVHLCHHLRPSFHCQQFPQQPYSYCRLPLVL